MEASSQSIQERAIQLASEAVEDGQAEDALLWMELAHTARNFHDPDPFGQYAEMFKGAKAEEKEPEPS